MFNIRLHVAAPRYGSALDGTYITSLPLLAKTLGVFGVRRSSRVGRAAVDALLVNGRSPR